MTCLSLQSDTEEGSHSPLCKDTPQRPGVGRGREMKDQSPGTVVVVGDPTYVGGWAAGA